MPAVSLRYLTILRFIVALRIFISFVMMINVNVNGSIDILCKSNVVDLAVLYARGRVDTPVRIRVA